MTNNLSIIWQTEVINTIAINQSQEHILDPEGAEDIYERKHFKEALKHISCSVNCSESAQ